jgi:archaellin
VNIQPGDRTLDVNGNFRARDSSLNTLDFSNGFLTSSGGYTSIQGSVSAGVGTTTIGTLKKGIVQVSTVDNGSSANRAAYSYFAYTASAASILVSNIAGDTTLDLSGTNIQISNVTSTKTYTYSITYFPMP